MKDKLNQFEEVLSQCCTNFDNQTHDSKTSSDHAWLKQNAPNPFNEKTIIRYYIPQAASFSTLKIYSLDGAELRVFNILEKGVGQVEISENVLSPGTYVYHLIVDGKQIDGKLMTLTK